MLSGNASHELPNYTSKHQVLGDGKGGGVSIYIHNDINFKIRADLSISNNDIESLFAKIVGILYKADPDPDQQKMRSPDL